MSFLWIGSGWWSVVGLSLDVLGFSLLAWDLLPEYQMNKAWKEIEQAEQEAREIENLSDISSEDPGFPAFRGAQRDNSLRKHLVSSRWALMRAALWSASYKLGKFQAEAMQLVQKSREKIALESAYEIIEQMKRIHSMAASNLSQRSRPPIRFGIALIIVGFFLQAWGSVPVG